MRSFRFAFAVGVILAATGFADDALAGPFWCRGSGVAPTFAFGNVGYAAGYSTAVTRVGWGGWCGPRWGGWCAPRWNWCGPRWGWGCRPWGLGCAPWYGATTWGFSDSVYLAVPAGGGATFFSGSLVPYPVWGGWGYPATWVPGWYGYSTGVALPSGIAPQFGPAGVLPFLGVSASTANANAGAIVARNAAPTARAVIAAVGSGARPGLVRTSTGIARLRAARLVAMGDDHLRQAAGDATRLKAALDAYRRAAVVAQDQPDIHLRQAIALVALGRQAQADEAVGRAVAVDGRLAAAPPLPAAGLQAAAPDPIFGDRPAHEPPPFAARGAAILREIAAQAGGEEGRGVVAVLADRWSQRFDRGLGALAANPAAAR